MKRQRGSFMIARRFVAPSSLVFLDESSAKTNMTPLYGRCPKGDRLYEAVPHGH